MRRARCIVVAISFTICFAARAETPVIQLQLSGLDAGCACGNDNEIVDADECNGLIVNLINNGAASATGIVGILSTSTPEVVISQAYTTYVDLISGAQADNALPLRFTTSPQFAAGSKIDFTLTVTTREGTTDVIAFNIQTGTTGNPERFDNNNSQRLADNGVSTSAIAVSGFTAPVGKVSVSMHIQHSFISDLTITLFGPDGTAVLLFRQRGGQESDLGTGTADAQRTVFDSGAATPIASGSAPFVGAFQPEENLGGFNGKTGLGVNGTWVLQMRDTIVGDRGTLQAWSLHIAPELSSAGGGPCPQPAVVNDDYSINKNNTLTVSAANGVLQNDATDNVARPLSAVLSQAPLKGTLTFNADGSFTYQPALNATGPDTFKYYAMGENSAEGTVTITIGNANNLPVLQSASAQPADALPGEIVTFSASAQDIDADTLTYSWDFGDGTSGAGTNPQKVYFVAGAYTVTVTVSDGNGGTASSTMTVTVHADPLSLKKMQIKLKFQKANSDSISMSGVLEVGATPLANRKFQFYAGGNTAEVTLDAKGKSPKGKTKLTISKPKAGMAKFSAKLAGSFAAELLDEGFVNENVKKEQLNVLTTIITAGKAYQKLQPQTYSAKKGKSGSSK